MAQPSPWWTAPNAVSMLRLALIPAMLALALAGWRRMYLVCLVVALLSDALDGWLARRLGQTSEQGAKLDSWADLSATLSIPVGVAWLWPDLLRREAVFIGVGIAAYVTPTLVGMAKFGRIPSYHTWGAKVMAVAMGPAVIILLLEWTPWPFRVLIPLAVLEACEEIAMTLILPQRRSNIPSAWHAWQLRRQMVACPPPRGMGPG